MSFKKNISFINYFLFFWQTPVEVIHLSFSVSFEAAEQKTIPVVPRALIGSSDFPTICTRRLKLLFLYQKEGYYLHAKIMDNRTFLQEKYFIVKNCV